MYSTLAVTLTIICYTTSIPTIKSGHRERREARGVWIALDELRTLIPDLTDNMEQRLEANEGPGTFYDDRNYPIRDHTVSRREVQSKIGLHDSMKSLNSMLRVLSPSTVKVASLGDHKHHMQARPADSELTVALESMEELAEVEEEGDVVIGLTLAVSGMERANNVLEEGKGELEALRMIEKVEKTLIIISQGRERVRRSTDGDQGHAVYNEGVKNKVHKENKVYRSNFTPAQFDWLLDQFDLSREEVDDLQLLSGDKFDEMLARVEMEATSSKRSNIWEYLELLRDLPRNIVPYEVEAAAYGALGVTSHILERVRQRVEPSAQEVRYKLLPQIVDSVPKDVREWAYQGGKIAVRNAKLVADYTGPKLADLYDSIDRLQAQMRQSAGETVQEVGPALQSLAEELRQNIEVAKEATPNIVENLGNATKLIYKPVVESVVVPVARRGHKLYQDRLEPVVMDIGQFYSESVEPTVEAVGDYYEGTVEAVGDYYEGTVEPALGEFSVWSGEVVREQIIPTAGNIGDTVKSNAPRVKQLTKDALDGVFTGVPRLVQQLSHEAYDAAKVFNGKYSATLDKLESSDDQPSGTPVTKVKKHVGVVPG